VTSLLLLIGGIALVVVGFVALALPVVPGGAIVYVGLLLVAAADGFAHIGVPMIVALGLLAIAASVVDNVAGVLGARWGGASWWGVAGAMIGMLVGLPFGLVGLIVGPPVGALALEYLKNPSVRAAARAGAGSLAGFFVGVLAKYVITLVMIGLAAAAYLY
jgi:hypothetical protein